MAQKRAAGYLRRSTDKQEASIPDQRTAVQQYADQHGYKIIRWYTDDAISGDETAKRLDFLRMMNDAKKGDFEAIVCWDQDRFGRFSPHEASYWTWPLSQAGIQLVTIDKGPIDWNDFTEWLTYSVNQHGKHQFLKDLSRNVTRGQREAAKNGGWIGGIPYAYRLEGERKNKRLVLGDSGKARIVERIFREFVTGGRSMCDIANRLQRDGIPSPGGRGKRWRSDTVKVILENPAYVGDVASCRASNGKYHCIGKDAVAASPGKRCRRPESEWIVHPDHHPPIIDRATFAKAQAILAKGKTGRSTKYGPDDNPYLLSGLLRCGKCGRPMHGIDRRGGRCVYECAGKKYHGTCAGSTVREDDVFKCLVQYIESEILPANVRDRIKDKAKRGDLTEADLPESFRKLKQMLFGNDTKRDESKDFNKQISALNKKLSQARENLAVVKRENIPAIELQIERFLAERADLESRLRNIPVEADINKIVQDLLRKLCWLSKMADGYVKQIDGERYVNTAWPLAHRTDVVKPILRELDSIVVNTAIHGKGTGLRHAFLGGKVLFRQVGTVTGNVNPHQPG